MIKRYYAEVLPDGTVEQTLIVSDPDEGPPQLPETVHDFYPIPGPLGWTPPRAGMVKKWIDGTDVWVSTADLETQKAESIAKAYKDVDDVYRDAVGNRTTEYNEAEQDALAFKAAGYTGTVSEYVSSYAQYNPTGVVQSDQWAADVIIARANAFRTAQRLMRSVRFARQAQMQAAANDQELATAVALWSGFIAQLRIQLGLPPKGD